MTVVDKVTEKLEKANILFKRYEHEPVITSSDAAKIRKTALHIGAKALLFVSDGTPIVLVVSGDRKVDTKKFKDIYKVKDLRMATDQELKDLTGLEKGAIPPLGSVFDIKSYYDAEIEKTDKVAFNAGSRSVSIIMNSTDLIKVESPVIGSFSKPIDK